MKTYRTGQIFKRGPQIRELGNHAPEGTIIEGKGSQFILLTSPAGNWEYHGPGKFHTGTDRQAAYYQIIHIHNETTNTIPIGKIL